MTEIIIYALILIGTFFIFLAALGLIRFKDIYSRLHSGTKAPSFGIFLLVLGVCIYFNSPIIYIKGLFIVIFIYLTSPLSAHAIIKSFHDVTGKNKFPDEDLPDSSN